MQLDQRPSLLRDVVLHLPNRVELAQRLVEDRVVVEGDETDVLEVPQQDPHEPVGVVEVDVVHFARLPEQVLQVEGDRVEAPKVIGILGVAIGVAEVFLEGDGLPVPAVLQGVADLRSGALGKWVAGEDLVVPIAKEILHERRPHEVGPTRRP